MVKIKFNDFWYDLTPFVDYRSITIKKTGDKTLDSASFKMPQVRDALSGLDLSRALPRLARVQIRDDEFIIATDSVNELDDDIYSHEVECISVAKLLADTTNAGLSVTQPQGDIGLYYRSFSQNLGDDFSGLTKQEIPLTTIEQSQDLTEIQGRTLKKDKNYKISFKTVVYTKSIWLDLATPNYHFITVFLEVGGNIVYQETKRVEMRTLGIGRIKKQTISYSLDYANEGTQDVKIYIKAEEVPQSVGYNYSFEDTKLTISSTDEITAEKITLDYVVEKILRNDINEQKFYLEPNSKSYLSQFYSYEWTLPESYLWLQLSRVADYIKAFPSAEFAEIPIKSWDYIGNYTTRSLPYDMYLFSITTFASETVFLQYVETKFPSQNYVDDFVVCIKASVVGNYYYAKVISTNKEKISVIVKPFDELLNEYEPIGITEAAKQATIDDYASALEISAKNVYSETNTLTEITSLRAEGDIRQIGTEDLIVPTTQRIGEVVSFKIRVPFAITIGSITKNAGDWVSIDINRILRQEYYNTLPSLSDYTGTGRFGFSKNNCLYFADGESGVRGLSYLGEQEREQFQVGTYIRAIYEVLIAQLTRDNGDSGLNYNTTYDNGTTARDNEIAVEISYRPYTETNAVIHKSDQSGFEFKTIKYLNETMAINNPDIIGEYTQGIADRSGGTVHTFSGYCLYEELPDVLTTWGDLTLFAVGYQFLNENEVSYSLQYIKDYVFISSYESYDKKERIFQVPRDTIQDRVLKKNTIIEFTTTQETPDITGHENINAFVNHLFESTTAYLPKWALITHDTRQSILPVVTQRLSRVIEYRVAMKDNYSAGLYKTITGGNTYQQDHRYTNDFGRVEKTTIDLYRTMPTLAQAQINALPSKSSITLTNKAFSATLNERKDARERSVYSMQFSYVSGNSDIIIYEGITKFSNAIPQTKTYDLRWVNVNKIPAKQQKLIDLSTITGDVLVNGAEYSGRGQIQVISTLAEAIVCYDTQSLEIILVDKRKVQTRNIYYRGKNQ